MWIHHPVSLGCNAHSCRHPCDVTGGFAHIASIMIPVQTMEAVVDIDLEGMFPNLEYRDFSFVLHVCVHVCGFGISQPRLST